MFGDSMSLNFPDEGSGAGGCHFGKGLDLEAGVVSKASKFRFKGFKHVKGQVWMSIQWCGSAWHLRAQCRAPATWNDAPAIAEGEDPQLV